MIPLSLKALSIGVALLMLSSTLLGQTTETGRNITIPSSTTTTSGTTNSTNTAPTNGTTTATTGNSTQANNNSTSHTNSTTSVKLTPVADATGASGSVPVPASTGGKPNGRYGPDDGYIASGVSKVGVPNMSTLFIMSCTVAVTIYGALP
jgi:hypothetical protein